MKNRPNILFINTDQFRFDYMGCAGADFVNTPNIDRIAERGVRFRYCYSNSPLCAPARIGLATGMHPQRIGAVDNSSYLLPGQTTYYQRLRDAGYRVGAVGKLDLAKPDEFNGRRGDRPCLYQWGFTHPVEIEGKVHSLHHSHPHGPYGFWLKKQGLWEEYRRHAVNNWNEPDKWVTPTPLPAATFLDSFQGMKALEWLDNVGEDYPWHLFVTFSGPHVPHDPPQEFADRYEGRTMPPAVPVPEWDPRPDREDQKLNPDFIQQCRRMYCAYIELIDHWIGRILDKLEREKRLANTYIFFSADHGEMLGDLGRFAKKYLYEPSAHIPLLAAGPGVPQGKISDALVELIDLNATICDVAGLPPRPAADARSFRKTLERPDAGHREEAVSEFGGSRSARTGRYKLILNEGSFAELYDLQHDPHEQNNVYEKMESENPELIHNLERRLINHYQTSPYGPPR